MKITLILLVAMFLLLVATDGCKKDENPVAPGNITTGVIMKLTVGNFWIYEGLVYDTSGNIIHTDTTGFMAVRDTIIDAVTWYLIGRDSTAKEMLANRSDGLWYARLRSGSDTGVAPYLFAKYPATVNYSWLYPDSTTAKVISIDTNLALPTIPDTTFSSYLYEFTAKGAATPETQRYFPPGIGFARDEVYGKTASGRIFLYGRRDLLGARIAKTPAENPMARSLRNGTFLHPRTTPGK